MEKNWSIIFVLERRKFLLGVGIVKKGKKKIKNKIGEKIVIIVYILVWLVWIVF